MKMKNSVKLIFASALLLTAVSCAKDVSLQVPGETPVRFDIGVEGTKAELINRETETAFTTEGFKVIAYEEESTSRKMNKVAVTNDSGTWKTATDYYWKKNTKMTFYAFYPQDLATSLDSKTTNAGIAPFTYSPLASGVTADVTGQTDYMLATYSGTGTNGKATLNFSHLLASIQFKIGTFDSGVTKIKSIAIGGFYKMATCTPTAGNAGFTYAWSGQSGTAEDGALEQSGLNQTPAPDAVIGTPFLLIPGQDFSTKNLTVLLTITENSVDKTLLATIKSGTLVQGQTTNCTINYENGKGLNFSCELTPWSAEAEVNMEVEEVISQAADEVWYLGTDPATAISWGTLKDKDGSTLSLVNDEYVSSLGYRVAKYNGEIHTICGNAFQISYGQLTKLLVPPKTVTIEKYAFLSQGNGLVYKPYIYLPDSVTNLSGGAFKYLIMFYPGQPDQQIAIGFTIETSKGTFSIGTTSMGANITLGNGTTVYLDASCFIKGTLISLADGTKKKVEDLTYDDDLLVWNFDEGKLDSAKLLWITNEGLKADHWYKITLSDGTELGLCGSDGNCHRLFNYTDKTFEYASRITLGKEIYTENGAVTLENCERIEEEVEYYNLITNKHINCFANGVLAASHFNNVYPIDSEMKFIKDGRKIRPWKEFKKEFKKAGIGKDWYEGVRLGEQPDSLDDVVKRLANKEALRLPRPEDKNPGFFARIWNWIKGVFSK